MDVPSNLPMILFSFFFPLPAKSSFIFVILIFDPREGRGASHGRPRTMGALPPPSPLSSSVPRPPSAFPAIGAWASDRSPGQIPPVHPRFTLSVHLRFTSRPQNITQGFCENSSNPALRFSLPHQHHQYCPPPHQRIGSEESPPQSQSPHVRFHSH